MTQFFVVLSYININSIAFVLELIDTSIRYQFSTVLLSVSKKRKGGFSVFFMLLSIRTITVNMNGLFQEPH